MEWSLAPQQVPVGLCARLLPGLRTIGIVKGPAWDLQLAGEDLDKLIAHGVV